MAICMCCAAIAINGSTQQSICTSYIAHVYHILQMLIILRPQYTSRRVREKEKKLIRIVINFLIGFGCYPNKIKQTNSNKISTRVAQQQSVQRERSAPSFLFFRLLRYSPMMNSRPNTPSISTIFNYHIVLFTFR